MKKPRRLQAIVPGIRAGLVGLVAAFGLAFAQAPAPAGGTELVLAKAQQMLQQQLVQAQNAGNAQAVTRLRELIPTLEADRLLLSELRKEFPEDTAEASAYVDQLRSLALKSDPTRLGPIATRVGELAPAFLKWRDQNFDSQEAAAREYVRSGARDFRTVFGNFNNAILQTIINHLDTLLDQLGALR